MTGLLKDTFTERATAGETPPLDLDSIIQSGNQRIRRRRTTAVLSIAVASALILAGGIAVAQNITADAPTSGVPAFMQKRPTYADGNEIHYGANTIKVSEKVDSLIQTDVAFVYSDKAGSVFATDGRTETKIGEGNKRRELRADDNGTVVGWVDARDDIRQFVLYDVAQRRELARTPVGNQAGPPANDDREPRIVAIDNGQAYFAALDGLHQWDIDSGRETLVLKNLRANFLYDVSNGLLAYDLSTPDGGSIGTAISPSFGSKQVRAHGPTDLSPDGKFAHSEGTGSYMVTNSSTGDEISFGTDYDMLALSVWLDDTTFTTIGAMEDGNPRPMDLLTCSVTTRSCTVAVPKVSPPITGDLPTFRIADGTPFEE
jgi:hypothetical protein